MEKELIERLRDLEAQEKEVEQLNESLSTYLKLAIQKGGNMGEFTSIDSAINYGRDCSKHIKNAIAFIKNKLLRDGITT